MGATNWCLGRGGPGSSGIYPRHSGIGCLASFLCLGMTKRLLLVRCRVIFLGYPVGGESCA